MGLFSKLMFWRHEPDIGDAGMGLGGLDEGKETGFGMGKDELGLGRDSTAGLGGTGEISSTGPMEKEVSMRGPGFEHFEEPTPLKSAPLEKKPIYYQEIPQQGQVGPAYQQPYQRDVSKDLEIISAKLDTIKSMLDAINHRIDSIERQQGKKGRMEW